MCGYPVGVFNIGPGEIIIVALVLLIAVGPEQLPGVIRRAGRVVSQARSMTEGLRSDFMAGMDEIERATDPNAWAASAGPSDGSKPEKKHTAAMADADGSDDADGPDGVDAASSDEVDADAEAAAAAAEAAEDAAVDEHFDDDSDDDSDGEDSDDSAADDVANGNSDNGRSTVGDAPDDPSDEDAVVAAGDDDGTDAS